MKKVFAVAVPVILVLLVVCIMGGCFVVTQ